MSIDFKLDSSTHDLVLNKGITLTTEGAASLGQKVKIALLLRTTEWPINISAGVPYSQSIFSGKNNKSFIDSFMQNYILSVPGVGRLVKFTTELGADRRYTIKFTAVKEQETNNVEVVL